MRTALLAIVLTAGGLTGCTAISEIDTDRDDDISHALALASQWEVIRDGATFVNDGEGITSSRVPGNMFYARGLVNESAGKIDLTLRLDGEVDLTGSDAFMFALWREEEIKPSSQPMGYFDWATLDAGTNDTPGARVVVPSVFDLQQSSSSGDLQVDWTSETTIEPGLWRIIVAWSAFQQVNVTLSLQGVESFVEPPYLGPGFFLVDPPAYQAGLVVHTVAGTVVARDLVYQLDSMGTLLCGSMAHGSGRFGLVHPSGNETRWSEGVFARTDENDYERRMLLRPDEPGPFELRVYEFIGTGAFADPVFLCASMKT